LGCWGSADGEPVVLLVWADDRIEIACHGGQYAAARILDTLCRAGAELVPWTTWVRSDCSDAIEAEAIEALAGATTTRTAAILLDQHHGALRREIERLCDGIRTGRLSRDDVIMSCDRLLQGSKVGLHLTSPWAVAIVGRPNVGKSSLLNGLVGYYRAIVHAEPGTTRDVVSARVAFDGWPIELRDTAGMHQAADDLERAGVERAAVQVRQSDLQLVVLDRSEPLRATDWEILAAAPEPVVVANKSDRPPAWPLDCLPVASHCVSALSGEGVAELIRAIVQRLVPSTPEPRDAVPFTPREVERLEAARAAAARDEPMLGRLQDVLAG
jgi:tRNA modification GTPase